jgi:hypothetical protein
VIIWWLSFVDPDRAEGDRFLGACVVETVEADMEQAVKEAWFRGCNPGGEVSLVTLTMKEALRFDRNRLFMREELNDRGMFSERQRRGVS